ncbi:MAG: DegQ family serine endoprotease [Proteobacteria bacterium]|nr:DegQ family serine endoprotease [Pseudomonadota bacterium]
MPRVKAKRIWLTCLVVVVAAVACGAAGAQGDKGADKGKGGPLKPTTYDPQLSFAPLVEKVAPAVVNIQTKTKVNLPGLSDPGGFFEFFFGPRGRGGPMQPRERTQQAAGSGFIIEKDGLVVTNHHVVDGATEIEVQLADERRFDAELVGSDERTDLALLRLRGAKGLPTVEFGDSDRLRVGDHVVAIGNPFGLDHTVTAGIVSAKERVIGAGPYDAFIQTDASINPGNSGGPLFNLEGQVVGINTAIVPQGQGIGFAIPSSLAEELLVSLRSGGKVVRGWLGLVFQPLDEALAKAFGVERDKGALVADVTAGSPAEKAGILVGDVIVEVDGKALESARRLPALVAKLKPGTKAPVTIVRQGKRKKIDVEIGEMPAEIAGDAPKKAGKPGEGATAAALGFSVRPLDEGMRRRLGAAGVDGVVVAEVDPESPAAEALRSGDVISELNRTAVRDVAGFEALAKGLKKGDDLLLRVFRQGAWSYLVIRL